MFTPYDWQEGIGNRAQYIESKLIQGAPVVALSLDLGILVFTYRRQARKIYEIYDRLIFAGIGQQSDVEAMRVAALEFASREGYNRSEEDVTIQRVATALSAPQKRAFSDFTTSPIVARSLFGEVNATPDEDLFYTLDYDGDYSMYRKIAAIAGTDEAAESFRSKLAGFDVSSSVDDALTALKRAWIGVVDPEGENSEDETLKGLMPEAVLLERSSKRENRFRALFQEEF